MNYISSDRTMQEIVYKLVPGLQERELQRQKEFEVAMFMYRTGEQQNAYNVMNSTKTHGTLICLLFCIKSSRNARPSQNLFIG